MRDQAVVARVEHREVLAQPRRDVVGREHRSAGGVGETLGAHHPHVGPADREDARAAVGRRRDGAAAVLDALHFTGEHMRRVLRERVPGQERREVRLRGHRADARPAAAVRNAERLVQVEMADVAAEVAEAGVAEQRVEVRAVDVDLATRVVHRGGDGDDLVLVDAVGRRVRDHQGREGVGVRRDLGAKVVEVDVAELVGRDDDDAHAGEDGRRGVGAVRGLRDEAHGALVVAARAVVAADREQAGELALAARVRLQRDGVVAGHVGEPALELVDQLEGPGDVGRGRERVEGRELGPGDGLHLGGGVELHRARAERDHPAVERVVAVGSWRR